MINKLLYDEINFKKCSKIVKNSFKTLIKSMKSYSNRINDKFNESGCKINKRIEIIRNIKRLIQIYLRLSKWKCVNSKDILNSISSYNL